jgi:hypothetical protein
MRHHAQQVVGLSPDQSDWLDPRVGYRVVNDQSCEVWRGLPAKSLRMLLESDSVIARLFGVTTAYSMGPAAKSILKDVRKLERDEDPEVRAMAERVMRQAREAGWTRD